MTRGKVKGLGFLRGANNHNQDFFSAIALEKEFIVGSDSNCDLVINAPYIADKHCIISSHIVGLDVFAYLTCKSTNGVYMNRDFIDYNETVIMYPACVLTFVSCHINLYYIQAYQRERNTEYEEKFLVPLYSDSRLKNMMISVTEKMIGCGRQSMVYLANVEKRLGMQLACKKHKRVSFFFQTGQNSLATEIQILKSNNHVNVLSVIDSFERGQETYTFSPLYLGGTLQIMINKSSPLIEQNAIFIYFQIASGLTYLHEKGIIHCDLKPDNILLSSADCYPRVLISDFGLSIFSKAENIWPENYGTNAYHAPEIVKQELFTEKVDNWALGIILFQMLSKFHPFMDKSHSSPQDKQNLNSAILNRVPNFDLLGPYISEEAKETIGHLLDKSPNTRWSPNNEFIFRWVFQYGGSNLFHEIFNTRKSFDKEKSLWVGCNSEEKEKEEAEESYGLTYDPDKDEKEVKRLLNSKNIFQNNLKYRFKTQDDFLAFNEEIYPDRTLKKKRLLDYAFVYNEDVGSCYE